MTEALTLIGQIMDKLDKMSITNDDVDEIKTLFDDLEKQLDAIDNETTNAPGDDDDSGLGNLFQQAADKAEDVVEDVKKSVEETSDAPSVPDVKAESVDIEPVITGNNDEITEIDVIPSPSNDSVEDIKLNIPQGTGNNKTRKSRSKEERRELSSAANREKYAKDLEGMVAAANRGSSVGGKTRRRRSARKTIKKGGYVLKKKNNSSRKLKRKHKKNSKSSSGAASSSKATKSSSSSSSSR